MMQRLVRRGRMLVHEVRSGDADRAVADLRRWAWSEAEAVGFRFDARAEHVAPPPALVDLVARPLDDQLAERVFDFEGLGSADRLYLERRQNIHRSGLPGGWVAVDPDGNPAYLQWLIPAMHAAQIGEFFGPIFGAIASDTLLVEGAWIPPAFRKQKVMGAGLALVTEAALAASPEARYAVCYPAADNRGAVLGTRSAGYEVFEKRTEQWRLGRRSFHFAPATESDFAVFQR